MKILYAIQATGNGHIARAEELLPYLTTNASVDILVSGTSSEIELGHPIKFKFTGLSFVFGQKGGVHIWKTIAAMKLGRFLKDVKEINLGAYDMVISDFEPVSAWASLWQKKYCVALSHQFSLLDANTPKPLKNNRLASLLLKYYAPVTKGYGFHFERYSNDIYLPIIKREIKQQQVSIKNYFVVYLPAYGDEILIKVLSEINKTNWIVFSKHTQRKYAFGNVVIEPIAKERFNKKLINCRGVLCGAGFETPAETLYLKKQLMVIPMKNQYEQQCNAQALKALGVPVLYDFNTTKIKEIKRWVLSKEIVAVDYESTPQKIVNKIFIDFIKQKVSWPLYT